MLISYRWLARHVSLEGKSPEDVARDLTLHVAEVEGVERFAPHLSDVVVGFVREREQHPNADRLSLCQVESGDGEVHQIVCGAPNVDAGQKIALARVGTRLPGDFKIKKSKIRGVESAGMICSERELELGDDHDGIWVLPDESVVGRPVAEAVGADDWIIEIDNKAITHRPDLWGHRGVAAELAALWERTLLPLDDSLPEAGSGPAFDVRVESERCSRYLALPIDGVAPRKSPDWLRLLLLAVGQRPIDLLVDVSNFVMLDLGQPNHLFDRTRISEGIVVRDARAGEVLQTLDGEERALEPSDLLICSGDEPVALAGIMGGEASKVAEGTSSLLLEVASFDAVTVRRTATRIGLRTDASARFEKSLSPLLPLSAAGHLVRTLQSVQPDLSLPAPLTDAGSWTDPTCEIELRPDRVRSLLGVETSDAEIAATLERLGFGVRVEDAHLAVTVPAARATKDVGIEEDLIEEVGRFHGYGRIEERPLLAEVRPVARDPRREMVRRIQDCLAGGARFHEALTYSFVSEDLLRTLDLADQEYVRVTNPVAEGADRVRRAVLPSLLGRLEPNLRRRDQVRLFEVGKGTLPEQRDDRGKPAEVHELALVWAGPRPAADARFDANNLARLKGVLEDLLRALSLPAPTWELAADAPGWAHRNACLRGVLAADEAAPAVTLSQLEPGVARALSLGEFDVACANVSLDRLLAIESRPRPFEPLPRYPGVKIDVALALDEGVTCGVVEESIRRSGKGLVKEIELFDVYRGGAVGEGRRSLAFHVLLQAPDKTLSDKDGQKFLGRLERAVAELGGELRKE